MKLNVTLKFNFNFKFKDQLQINFGEEVSLKQNQRKALGRIDLITFLIK